MTERKRGPRDRAFNSFTIDYRALLYIARSKSPRVCANIDSACVAIVSHTYDTVLTKVFGFIYSRKFFTLLVLQRVSVTQRGLCQNQAGDIAQVFGLGKIDGLRSPKRDRTRGEVTL